MKLFSQMSVDEAAQHIGVLLEEEQPISAPVDEEGFKVFAQALSKRAESQPLINADEFFGIQTYQPANR